MENKTNTCHCCQDKNIVTLYNELKDLDHGVDGEFSLKQCQNCRLEFLYPSLNEKELEKYYPKEDYYSFKERIKLAVIYHKISSYFYSKKNALFNLILFPFKSLLYTYYLDIDSKEKSLLEIGCGSGLQLEIYKKYGIKTRGIEPYGPQLTKKEKALGISRDTIKNAKFKNNKFDYIVLKEVLEHIPNQEEVLGKCHSWLKPSGKLMIVVPNRNGLWRELFKETWYGYDIPRHLYNYNPRNISFYLKKFGFNKINVRTYDLPYMLDGSLKFYLTKKRGRDKKGLIGSGLSKLILTPLSLLVTYFNKGSLMEIECSK